MTYLIGVVGLLGLAGLYVGMGLADRGRKGCGGCALRDLDDACGAACPADGAEKGGRQRRPAP